MESRGFWLAPQQLNLFGNCHLAIRIHKPKELAFMFAIYEAALKVQRVKINSRAKVHSPYTCCVLAMGL